MWLTNANLPYKFGGKSYTPHRIQTNTGISNLLSKINLQIGLELDSCLITRYMSGDQALSLHQDNESILDGSHPIALTSVGSPRTLQFWNAKCEDDGSLINEVTVKQGDLLIMEAGCQDTLWHKVLPATSETQEGIRYALSFRKMKSNSHAAPHELPSRAPGPKSSSPISQTSAPLKPLDNGFMVHPNRLTEPKHIKDTNSVQLPPHRTPTAPTLTHCHNTPTISPKHLIIGDSMVNSLQVQGSISIFKGGIRPHELLTLLPSCVDILHPNCYDDIRSVTVVVGTNALNVKHPSKGKPLHEVVSDYEKLVLNLRDLFPNARVGLYNVLPRAYTCIETRDRIENFNTILEHYVAPRLQNIYWIHHYQEFLDEWGYLRSDVYGKRGIHLKPKGKAMMAKTIKNFQRAYT